MGDDGTIRELVARRYADMRPYLDERQRRLLLGAEARVMGRGGIKAVAQATGVHPDTVARGARELEPGGELPGRTRAQGGGRKRLADTNPGLVPALMELVDPETRSDPESPLRWTTKSTYDLADALTRAGHACSSWVVASLLRAVGYSLRGNAKVTKGAQHADRDNQFAYINAQVTEHLAAGQPVVSVDTKKKEQVGQIRDGGGHQPTGQPPPVDVHDLTDKQLGKAIPYGIHGVDADTSWVSVSRDHDTAAFAVETLRRWWQAIGKNRYPNAERLLICAHGGESNGYRLNAWKIELAAFAAGTGLRLTCCHFPPGTSKWNQIEHGLCPQITLNWRGLPLTSHEVVVELICATRTATGLSVDAGLNDGSYPTSIQYTTKQVGALPLDRHQFHGDWNYTHRPAQDDTPS